MKTTTDPIDSSLSSLSTEVNSLFSVLNQISNKIKKIEASLRELKMNVPFKFSIDETRSVPKSPKESHQDAGYLSVEYYIIKTSQILAWMEDENTKQYRLTFIVEEEEIIGCTGIGECCNYKESFQTNYLLKKPLIETSLETRLKISTYLTPFIKSYEIYLKDFRKKVESQNELL